MEIEKIERIGRFMKETGLTVVEVEGLKLVRSPQETYYGALGKQAAEVAATPKATDDDILMNPFAGMDGIHG